MDNLINDTQVIARSLTEHQHLAKDLNTMIQKHEESVSKPTSPARSTFSSIAAPPTAFTGWSRTGGDGPSSRDVSPIASTSSAFGTSAVWGGASSSKNARDEKSWAELGTALSRDIAHLGKQPAVTPGSGDKGSADSSHWTHSPPHVSRDLHTSLFSTMQQPADNLSGRGIASSRGGSPIATTPSAAGAFAASTSSSASKNGRGEKSRTELSMTFGHESSRAGKHTAVTPSTGERSIANSSHWASPEVGTPSLHLQSSRRLTRSISPAFNARSPPSSGLLAVAASPSATTRPSPTVTTRQRPSASREGRSQHVSWEPFTFSPSLGHASSPSLARPSSVGASSRYRTPVGLF